MTATDELRRLLDGRGVEYTDAEDAHTQYTWWSDGDHEIAACNSGERLAVYDLTPAQAVEATLGSGTCRIEKRHMDWRCTGCGEIVGTDDPTSELFIDGNAVELWRYCPNCGAKVVDA